MINAYSDPPLEQTEAGGRAKPSGGIPPVALDQAVRSWERRGYHVTYRDAYLAQLARQESVGLVVPVLGALIGALVAVLMWSLTATRRRSWFVVTLAATPEGRIVSHRQRTRRFPEQ